MTTKCECVIAELEQFCRERNIQLATSGYDSLQVWDLKEDEQPLHFNGIEDRLNTT